MAEDTSINETFVLAMRELADADYEKSVELLNSILARASDHKLAWSARGAAYLKSGRFDAGALPDGMYVVQVWDDRGRAAHCTLVIAH